MSLTREQLLEAADILDRAHDVILDRGWSRNVLEIRQGGRACIESAISRVCGRASWQGTTLDFAIEARKPWLVELLQERQLTYSWNDDAARTADEVFDRLRSVAKDLREEAGAP